MGLIRQSRYCRGMICLLAAMWAFLALRALHRPAHPAPNLLTLADPALVVDEERLAGLDRRIPSLSLGHVGLGDAIDLLCRKTGARIVVRWSMLDQLQATPQTSITLSLRHVTLATALRVILRQASPEIQYGIAPGATIVVTRGWKDAPKTFVAYDLRELDPSPTMFMSSNGLQSIPGSQVAFEQSLLDFLVTGDRSIGDSPYTKVGVWGGRLTAMETPENHRRLRGILKGLTSTIANIGEENPPAPGSPLERLLEQPVAEVRFENVSLERAIDDLRERFKLNIVVDWPALQIAGVLPSATLHIHLWNVPLRLTLYTLLADDLDGHRELDFDIEDNVLTITKVNRRFGDVKVYDVRDIVEVAVARRPDAQAGTGQPPVAASARDPLGNPPSHEQIEQEESERLAGLVGESLYPLTESINDGCYVLDAWSGRLLIRASPRVHKHVGEFLQQLRAGINAPGTQPSSPKHVIPASQKSAPDPNAPYGGR